MGVLSMSAEQMRQETQELLYIRFYPPSEVLTCKVGLTRIAHPWVSAPVSHTVLSGASG